MRSKVNKFVICGGNSFEKVCIVAKPIWKPQTFNKSAWCIAAAVLVDHIIVWKRRGAVQWLRCAACSGCIFMSSLSSYLVIFVLQPLFIHAVFKIVSWRPRHTFFLTRQPYCPRFLFYITQLHSTKFQKISETLP